MSWFWFKSEYKHRYYILSTKLIRMQIMALHYKSSLFLTHDLQCKAPVLSLKVTYSMKMN